MSRDDGTTLVELMVGMVLMSIFLAMFTGAVVMMNGAMNKAQAVNQSASQLNAAFLNVSTTVQYALHQSPWPGRAGSTRLVRRAAQPLGIHPRFHDKHPKGGLHPAPSGLQSAVAPDVERARPDGRQRLDSDRFGYLQR